MHIALPGPHQQCEATHTQSGCEVRATRVYAETSTRARASAAAGESSGCCLPRVGFRPSWQKRIPGPVTNPSGTVASLGAHVTSAASRPLKPLISPRVTLSAFRSQAPTRGQGLCPRSWFFPRSSPGVSHRRCSIDQRLSKECPPSTQGGRKRAPGRLGFSRPPLSLIPSLCLEAPPCGSLTWR